MTVTPSDSFDAIFVGAMSEETEPVRTLADSVGPSRVVAGMELTSMSLRRRRVLVVRSGIGLVNAAMAATTALWEGGMCPVLSIGSAGGLGAHVRVGQAALGVECRFSKADARAFGYELGQVPQMPAAYSADDGLLAAARWCCDELELAAVEGLVLSSDVFVTPAEAASALRDFPSAISVDMESAAIAQVCHRFGAPFCSVRAISDLCGPDAGGDFDRHIDGAAERSAELAAMMVSRL